MKFTVFFKTPDAAYYAMKDVRADGAEADVEAAEALMEKFIEYGENISVEFDTDTGTATVVKL